MSTESLFTSDEVAFNHMVVRLWKDLEIMGFNWAGTEFEDDTDLLTFIINQVFALFIVGGVTVHRPKCRNWIIDHLGLNNNPPYESADQDDELFGDYE